jgi:hypothetical protein
MRWWKGVALAVVALVVVAAIVVWRAVPRPVAVVAANGYVVTLLEYQFTSNRVEYRYPKEFLFEKFLPTEIRKKFERATAKRVFVRPENPGEPMLSCAMTVRVPREEHGFTGRLVVGDEHGNEFDPVGQSAGNSGENPAFEVFEAHAFPRRGEKLKLKLRMNAETIAEFEVPNPARGEYPQWKVEPLPISAKAGDLEVRLVELSTERPKEYSGEKFPNTRCVFELAQRGEATTNWVPLRAEFSDATGNRWQPFWYREQMRYEGARLTVPFMGALWAGEEAWKVRMDFRQQAGFAEDELVRWEGLEVPTGAEVIRPRMVEEAEGRVELLGLFGPAADREAAQKIFLNINPRRDAVTMALKLGLAEFDRAFSLVGIYDENGRAQEVVAMDRGATTTDDERYVPLLVHFKPGAGVKKVDVVFALPKSRRVEFLPKATEVVSGK